MDRQPNRRASSNGGPEHLGYIDALRGWAFLLVMTVHIPQLVQPPAWVVRILPACNYGVQLFYVVSALTLFMSFEARRTCEQHPIRAFYIRRLFRIAPLFWLAILAYVWHSGMGPRDTAPGGISWRQILATVLFVHGWHPTSINSVVPGGWSIAVEMNFYLLLPLCFLLLNGILRSVIGCVAVLIGSVVVSVLTRRWLVGALPDDQVSLAGLYTYYWLPRQFAVFTLGFVLFACLKQLRPKAMALHPKWMTGMSYLSLALVLLLVIESERVPLAYFVISCAFALLAFSLAYSPITFLVNSVMRYIGKVSFSAYLCHFLVISWVGRLLRGWLAEWSSPSLAFGLGYFLVGLCTVALSTIAYALIEVPGQSLGRAIIKHLGYGRAVSVRVAQN